MALRINATHSHEDRGLDFYETPECATRALMSIETLLLAVTDPACGKWAILKVLRDAGRDVRDYLAEPIVMNDTRIICNPPFKFAAEFIRKAISDKCQFHAWLLRTNFLESVGRLPFWREHPPSRVCIGNGAGADVNEDLVELIKEAFAI
jgi:hypothetical protein